ncbi:hypothetical protein [Falsiroseomonas oryzae]|uniref:hypothetical protein n=1 Tax=Falsiroseomonas oryzae TaxID=2766473 RepID=UPI0022EB2101|nr:hypothetical protein [Roseomonas sp. MO-31]
MRLFRLARAAMEAEGLHLRRMLRARGIQAALAGVAAAFALMLLMMLHLAAFAALARNGGPVGAALLVAVGDLVLLTVFLFAARRAGHDPVAEEARLVRQQAVRQLGDGAARALVLAPLLRSQSAKKGLLGAAVTAMLIGLLSRR